MKIKVDGFKLEIDLVDLVAALGKDDVVTLARLVAADEQLFKGVLECVSSDSSLGHYFEDDPSGSWWFDSRMLLELREKLIPLMPVIAQRTVKEALHQRNQAQQEKREAESGFWRLYHAWPSDQWHQKPSLPRGYTRAPDPTPEEIEALFDSSSQPVDPASSSSLSSPQSPSEEPT